MSRKLLIILLLVPYVALMLWVAFLGFQDKSGRQVVVAVNGYDPRDLLSGRYVEYTIDWERTDCSQFEDGICPKEEFCEESHRRIVRTCRFYVNEKKADRLQKLLWSFNQKDLAFEVVYSYKKGFKPIAKQLLINGKDWQEILEQ